MMTLWICNKCKEHFEVPDFRAEGVDEAGSPEHWVPICPHCHSDDIDKYWDREDPDGPVSVK